MKILIGILDSARGGCHTTQEAEMVRFSSWPTWPMGGRQAFLGTLTRGRSTLARVIEAPAHARIAQVLLDCPFTSRAIDLAQSLELGTCVRPLLSIRQHMTIPQQVPAEAWELEIVGPH